MHGITNVGGKKMMVFNKPFFSSNVHKSKAFKNIKAVEATETITSTEDSTAESKTATSVTRTFTCTSQKTDNTTKRKPTPITLHQTPITTNATKASTSYSLDNLAAVSTGVYSASSPYETGLRTTENKIFRKSTEPSTLRSEVFTKSVTTLPKEMPTKALSTRGTQITSFPAGYTSHLIDASTAGPGGADNSDSPTTADKATSTDATTAGSGGVENSDSPTTADKATSTDNRKFRKSTEPSTLHSEVSNKSVTKLPMEMPTKALSTRGTQITSFPTGFTSHLINATTAGPGGVDNSDALTTADKATSTGAACKPEFNKKFTNSCYKFVDSGATMSAARSGCKADSSHLVFIETKEENDFLVEEAVNDTHYWIGIHERPNLFWDNGNQVTFANTDYDNRWTFNGRTGCYLMSKYSGRYWLDRDCSTQLRYICECEGAECKPEFNKKFNNSCYKFVDSGATMSTARSGCKADSSHLVFIETMEENDFLIREAEHGTQYWIGIHERPNLFWDNGNQVTFANIDYDNRWTFNGRTGCYRMSKNDGRYWLDRDCSTLYGYICECEGDDCPHGYNVKLHHSSYKFVDSGATRCEARSACKGDSSHLVFIETKEENDFLIGEARSNTEYWIGIHGRPNLYWDDGNQVTFTNIDPDNKNTFDDGTGCYRMYTNRERHWFDSGCFVQYGYICEYEFNQ